MDMKNAKLLYNAVIAGCLFGFTQMVMAAPISWVDEGYFSSEEDINMDGTVLRAAHGSRTTIPWSMNTFVVATTHGDVAFEPMGADSYANDITSADASVVGTIAGIYGRDDIYQQGGSEAFDDAMDTVMYNNGTPGMQEMQLVLSNLTIGATYQLQLFRSSQNSYDLVHNYCYFSDSPVAFGGNLTSTNLLGGQAVYATGQFTADATTQSAWAWQTGAVDDPAADIKLGAALNAYVLSAIPEPASLVLFAGVGAGLLYVRRFRSRS